MEEVPKMIGIRCTKCGKVMYPAHDVCTKCGAREFEEVELGDEASLVTYTVLTAVPTGVKTRPLVLGIVSFDGFDEPVRATGQVLAKPEEVEMGMKLTPDWGMLRMLGEETVEGFRFRPK
jgi:hypothetical protein